MAPAAAAMLSASHALAAPALLVTSPATATTSRRTTTIVVSASSVEPKLAISRRQAAVTSLAALSVFLFSSHPANARDIPLFGLKKAKKISQEVVQEVKELVKEGEGAISGAVSGAVAEFPGVPVPSVPSGEGLSPVVQAGAVAGAGVVGVLIASTVVNSLVSPAK